MNVSANRRYLEHQGRPFFYLADTAWKLLTVPTETEADAYLTARREQGFTVVMPVLATERNRGEEGERSAFLEDDPRRPDETHFARCDRIVARANELGLWVALLPTWGSYVGGATRDRPIFDEDSLRRYGEFVGRRYRNRDVIWVVGGDRPADDPALQARWRALAAGLAEGDGGSHLMTFHPPGLMGGGTSSRWFHEDDWLAFNMHQNGCRFLEDDLCARYLADYTRRPVKPFLDGETRYENSHRNFTLPRPSGPKITPYHVRQAAYYAMLCGALGHTYGCRDVWSFYVPSDRPPTRCVDTHWRVALRFPGAEQLRHWRHLFETYPWYRLVPDLATNTSTAGARGPGQPAPRPADQPGGAPLVTHGAWDGSGNIRAPAAISADGAFGLVYLPLPMPVWIDLTRVGEPHQAVDALWFDPRTGAERLIQRHYQKGEVRFSPPGGAERAAGNQAGWPGGAEPDWVLVLRAVP